MRELLGFPGDSMGRGDKKIEKGEERGEEGERGGGGGGWLVNIVYNLSYWERGCLELRCSLLVPSFLRVTVTFLSASTMSLSVSS